MEKAKRVPNPMNQWVRARVTPELRATLEDLMDDYGVDESELIRRMIIYINKRRPALGGEVIVSGKANALILEAA